MTNDFSIVSFGSLMYPDASRAKKNFKLVAGQFVASASSEKKICPPTNPTQVITSWWKGRLVKRTGAVYIKLVYTFTFRQCSFLLVSMWLHWHRGGGGGIVDTTNENRAKIFPALHWSNASVYIADIERGILAGVGCSNIHEWLYKINCHVQD